MCLESQRDSIHAASSFAVRNQIPDRLHEQMLAHLCLKYRTNSEGLQQQETLDALPHAIRSSISHYLFNSLVDNVYLFQGVSRDMLFQLVILLTVLYISCNLVHKCYTYFVLLRFCVFVLRSQRWRPSIFLQKKMSFCRMKHLLICISWLLVLW